ncbi:MAG: transglutaminase-like cysteine peptidase [Hoeflea sp.]|nr:transglutaminase-like cysteine peptidase [Alphaproteobacteria bacterium]MBV1724848.1 transglutaminase-like cysteine peptidase [Hoeflea sp.]MBU4544429.1 transglutaminase-like cysteine peptidase [Alphaproteobacteria bacterium]MBU4550334.1 transglutaminase-like cysteine peptidase [Alphaproteobacteria bacterium]MBV1760868.1 transglutaminase-like cysteine peptidase [Hoeflea sp.]
MFCGPGLTKRALIALIASIAIPAGAMASGLSMETGRITSQPIGHYEFCKQYASECKPVKGSGAAPKVTDYGWDVIKEINRAVNMSVMPKTDMEIYGREEVWAYPDVAGDCEDYVLLKRHMLIERGFSAADALITVVRKPDGEGHAVLTLRTSEGDFVLDNLVDEVKSWRDTPYSYLKRQASNNSGRWVTIENGSDVLVGAVK